MWLTLQQAADKFGYTHIESLRFRIRELRRRGLVSDIGATPQGFKQKKDAPVQVMWANPQAMMISEDSSTLLLNPQKGKGR